MRAGFLALGARFEIARSESACFGAGRFDAARFGAGRFAIGQDPPIQKVSFP
jgi:hypothetical protein